MKMQVIGQNMSLSEEEGQKFWPIYNHYERDLHEVNNQKYALLKQYAEMWAIPFGQTDGLRCCAFWVRR
jgi:5-methylcytosine-specific restriction endonuclease McrBC regulatory subunit McrC